MKSAIDKVKRKCLDPKSDYADRILSGERPERIITDLVRARVTCRFSDQIDELASAISNTLVVSPEHSVDHRVAKEFNMFGYAALHNVFEPANKTAPAFFFSGCFMEVQIRSVLMDQWSVVNWDIDYKPGSEISGEVKRRLASVAALFYLIDREFIAIRDEQIGASLNEDLQETTYREGDSFREEWRPSSYTLESFRRRQINPSAEEMELALRNYKRIKQSSIPQLKEYGDRELDALAFYLVNSEKYYWMTRDVDRENIKDLDNY